MASSKCVHYQMKLNFLLSMISLIDDFNRDGHKDILVVGNMFQAEIETPRNDAGIGLLLKGNGTSSFEPVAASQSGVVLPYDVKKAAKLRSKKGDIIIFAIQ